MNKISFVLPKKMETQRLYLRAYRAGDGPVLYAAGLRNREHLAEFESGNVLMELQDEEHAERIVSELAESWDAGEYFFIGLFEKATGAWVGQVYVRPTHRELPEFTIGYVADVDHEGKGIVSEAVIGVLGVLFEVLGAHRVISDCNENNLRSIRLLERCGFRREGHLLENRRNADGSFHGDFLYGMLRREYEQLYPRG